MFHQNIDWKSSGKKLFKYLFIAIIIGLAIRYIPKDKPSLREIAMISIIGAVAFALLDTYVPSFTVTKSDESKHNKIHRKPEKREEVINYDKITKTDIRKEKDLEVDL